MSSIPRIYWYAGARFLLVGDYGDSSIFSVVIPPGIQTDEPELVEHRWWLTLMGVNSLAEVCVKGHWHVIRTHQEFLIPAHTPHAFRNQGSGIAHFYATTRPGAFEDYLEEVAVRMPPDAYIPVRTDPPIFKIADWWIPRRGDSRSSRIDTNTEVSRPNAASLSSTSEHPSDAKGRAGPLEISSEDTEKRDER